MDQWLSFGGGEFLMVRGEGQTAQGLASPALIQKYLKGMSYPADKNTLMTCANENNAPKEVTEVINRLPEMEYISPAHVMKEVGKIE